MSTYGRCRVQCSHAHPERAGEFGEGELLSCPVGDRYREDDGRCGQRSGVGEALLGEALLGRQLASERSRMDDPLVSLDGTARAELER